MESQSLCVGLLALSCLAPQTARAQITVRVAEQRQVPFLVLPLGHDRVPVAGPVLGSVFEGLSKLPLHTVPYDDEDDRPTLFRDRDVLAPIGRDDLLDVIRTLIDPPSWENGATLGLRAGCLSVKCKKSNLDNITALVEQLERSIAPRYRVEAVIFDRRRIDDASLKALGGFAHVDRKEATRLRRVLLASRAVLHSGSIELRPQTVAHIGRRGSLEHIYDYGVEVAEKSTFADPRVSRIDSGTGWSLYPILLPDAQTLAFCTLLTHRVAVDPDGALEVATPSIAKLAQAKVAETQVAASFTASPWSAVLYEPGGTTHPGLAALLITNRITAKPVTEGPGISLLPHALLTSHATLSIGGDPETDEAAPIGLEPIDVETLIEELQALEDDGGDNARFFVRDLGTTLLLRGTAAMRRQAERIIALYAGPRSRSFLVTLQRQTRSPDGSGSWADAGRRMALPLLAYRRGFFLEGESCSYVRDYEAEIANKAAIGDPVVAACFDGLQLVASVQPVGERCLVTIDLADAALLELARSDSQAEQLGRTWSPRTSRVDVTRRFLMLPQKERVLGSGPLRRDAAGKLVETRLILGLREL